MIILSYFSIFSVFEEDNDTTGLGIIKAIFGFAIAIVTISAVLFFLEENNQKNYGTSPKRFIIGLFISYISLSFVLYWLK
jgi:hypothetical protein